MSSSRTRKIRLHFTSSLSRADQSCCSVLLWKDTGNLFSMKLSFPERIGASDWDTTRRQGQISYYWKIVNKRKQSSPWFCGNVRSQSQWYSPLQSKRRGHSSSCIIKGSLRLADTHVWSDFWQEKTNIVWKYVRIFTFSSSLSPRIRKAIYRIFAFRWHIQFKILSRFRPDSSSRLDIRYGYLIPLLNAFLISRILKSRDARYTQRVSQYW